VAPPGAGVERFGESFAHDELRTGIRSTLMDETMALTVMAGFVPAIHVAQPHRSFKYRLPIG
jgi:hypothetical protein